MTSTEIATRTVAELETRQVAGTAREIELATEARRLAYAAETRDDAAKRALAKLDAEDAKLRQQQLHLRDAMNEARRLLAEARRAEEADGLRDSAREVMALAPEAAERGRVIDQLARELCREIQGTFEDARRLTRLGAPPVNQRSLALSLTRKLLAQLRDAGLDIAMIAPGERHLAEELVGNYVRQATGWAERVIDATTKVAA